MLSLTRWNPFEELTGLHREMDRVFGRHLGDERAGTPAETWTPAAEINASDGGWKLRVALPGIDPKDVQIDLHGNSLTISGERTRSEQNRQGHASEFHYGRFERAFTLPANVDADNVVASYDHGVLELALPLAESAKPRRIAIGAGSNDKIEHAVSAPRPTPPRGGFSGRWVASGRCSLGKARRLRWERCNRQNIS